MPRCKDCVCCNTLAVFIVTSINPAFCNASTVRIKRLRRRGFKAESPDPLPPPLEAPAPMLFISPLSAAEFAALERLRGAAEVGGARSEAEGAGVGGKVGEIGMA